MMMSPLTSVRAVGDVAASATVRPDAAAQATAGADFGKVLADVAVDAVDALRAGEAAAISGINGTASTQQVVEAVMTAEHTLQTAIAVRDKLVSAYQEISRMQI